MKRLVVGAAIVDDVSKPTKLLAARRSYPEEHAGRWEFPGGKVEPGETPEDALRREIREELGLDIAVGTEIVNPDPGPWPLNDALEMCVFLCHITGTDAQPQPEKIEHDEIRWLSVDEIPDLEWLAPDLPVAESVQSIMRVLG